MVAHMLRSAKKTKGRAKIGDGRSPQLPPYFALTIFNWQGMINHPRRISSESEQVNKFGVVEVKICLLASVCRRRRRHRHLYRIIIVLWLNGACVLEQKLLLTARTYRKSWYESIPRNCMTVIELWGIDSYQVQNEWPWPLFRGLLGSCQPLRHICHLIYRKETVRDRGLVPKDHQ